jgi:hypothetical protein
VNTAPMTPPNSQSGWFGFATADTGALLAGAVSILAALLNSPTQQQFLVVFLFSSGVGLFFVMRETRRRKRAYALWFAGLVVGILILAWPQIEVAVPKIIGKDAGPVVEDNYYFDVTVYSDIHGRGNMSGLGKPVPGLRVIAHPQWESPVDFFTDAATGSAQVKLSRPGLEVIGVCGVYQTHYLSPRNSSPEEAREIKILVDPSLLPTCPR